MQTGIQHFVCFPSLSPASTIAVSQILACISCPAVANEPIYDFHHLSHLASTTSLLAGETQVCNFGREISFRNSTSWPAWYLSLWPRATSATCESLKHFYGIRVIFCYSWLCQFTLSTWSRSRDHFLGSWVSFSLFVQRLFHFVYRNSRAVADIACSLSIWAIKLSLLLTNLEPLMVSSVLLGTRSSHLELNDLVHLWKIFHYHLDLRTSSRVFAQRLSSAFTGWNSTV